LGPFFSHGDIPYLDSKGVPVDAKALLGRNLVFVNPFMDWFKAFGKHFLVENDLKLTHKLKTAYDIAQVYYADQGTVQEMIQLDLLIIMLNAGPANASYGNLLEGLIKDRLWQDKPTWIYSRYELYSEHFVKEYQDLGQLIGNKPFDSMKLSNPKPKVLVV
jgi:hypothetical protein